MNKDATELKTSSTSNVYHENESSDDENLSEVSLDEEDEELIWKVFFSEFEKQYGPNDDDDDSEEEEEEGDVDDGHESDAEELRGFNVKEELFKMNEQEKLNLLLKNLTEEQMKRYTDFRRGNISRAGVKKLANAVLNQSITNNVAVILTGASKVFVTELIEKSFEIKNRYAKAKLIQDIESKKKRKLKEFKEGVTPVQNNMLTLDEDGPLLPDHVREAWRLMRRELCTIPSAQWRRQGEVDGRMFM